MGERQESACHAEWCRLERKGLSRGAPEPSSSLLLKQLSMMRRFSSSKRSARLMPGAGADIVASPSVRNRRRALWPVGRVAGRLSWRGTARKLTDGGYSRTAGQQDVQNDVAGPGLRLCSRYGMRPCRPSELGTLGTQMPSTLVPCTVIRTCQACVGSVRRAPTWLLRYTPSGTRSSMGGGAETIPVMAFHCFLLRTTTSPACCTRPSRVIEKKKRLVSITASTAHE